MREQRLERLDLALGRLLAVHQQHAVARFVQGPLRALERRRVERAGDVRDDEADGVGRRGAERARELGGLELQGFRRFGDGGSRLLRKLTAAVQGARSRRRGDTSPPRHIRQGHHVTVPQTVAQAIATLS